LDQNRGSKLVHRDCIQVPEILELVLEPHPKPMNINRRNSYDSKFDRQIVSNLTHLESNTKAIPQPLHGQSLLVI